MGKGNVFGLWVRFLLRSPLQSIARLALEITVRASLVLFASSCHGVFGAWTWGHFLKR